MTDQQLLFDDDELGDTSDAPGETEDDGGDGGGRAPGSAGDGPDGPLRRLIDDQFLQYASYVIRDRAIPDLADGLKPVQRRIMWSLHENDDGKFTKVANIVGHAMQYHPHGDASITDALVTLVGKMYLIEGQGNFGNLHTGDPAAAARYIECRLTELAREEIFNDNLTRFVDNYDGRRKEPVTLPTKMPLLLMMGAEGIAVGISTRILPHNLRELLEAQVAILQKKPFRIYPDFRQGGVMDVSEYEAGNGRVRVRAVIERKDAERLVIREIPFGTTTDSLIASIEAAARKKKLKIRSIQDFTAEDIEIEIRMVADQDAARAIDALYAFTQCEMVISSRVIVIDNNRPAELDVDKVLRHNTKKLLATLQRELEWNRRRLQDEVHRKTLVQIFVENRIYKKIEECKTYQDVQLAVRKGFDPFLKHLERDISEKDIEMLLSIPIKRISRFDIERNRKEIGDILVEVEAIEKKLADLTKYAIQYVRGMIRKYASDCERRTVIKAFDEIEIREITAEELTLHYDRENGYLGTEIEGGDVALTCLSYDKVVMVWDDGRYKVTTPPERLFVDANMIYVAVADRDRAITMVYEDGLFTFLKKFTFGGTILNREYNCAGDESKVLYFSDTQPKQLYVKYHKAKRLRILEQIYDTGDVPVRGVKSRGNQMTSKKIRVISDTKPRGWKDVSGRPKGSLLG